MTRWHTRALQAEGPNGTARERTIARSAICGTGVGIYGLIEVREGLAAPRIAAMLYAHGGRTDGRHTWQTTCLDLQTAQEFVVSSEHADTQARRLRVTDLPPDLLADWPTHHGRPLPAGYSDNGRPYVGLNELRRIARNAAARNAGPVQASLFG